MLLDKVTFWLPEEVMAMPEARVFRPRSETEDQLIDRLMKVRATEGVIAKPSWTLYASYLVNKDLAEIRQRYKTRIKL